MWNIEGGGGRDFLVKVGGEGNSYRGNVYRRGGGEGGKHYFSLKYMVDFLAIMPFTEEV